MDNSTESMFYKNLGENYTEPTKAMFFRNMGETMREGETYHAWFKRNNIKYFEDIHKKHLERVRKYRTKKYAIKKEFNRLKSINVF